MCTLLERLAAYEDTGLEPEQVKAFVSTADNIVKLDINKIYPYAEITMYGKPLNHWRELSKAEQEGRLLVLPCKVGDTVYKVWYDPCNNGEKYPDSYGCSGCEDDCDIKKSIHEIKAPSVDWILRQLHNGSFVYFLTRKEAEAALKGAGGC